MSKRRFPLQVLSVFLLAQAVWSCQAVDNLLIGASGIKVPNNTTPTEVLSFPATHPVPFTAKDSQMIKRWDGQAYKDFYLKGINLGLGMPGTQAGDLAASREQYARWFQQMAELGFNNIRVYTLHYPRFYEELARYNSTHPDKPLYIFHGVWLDEEVEQYHDLYKATTDFQTTIRENVDAVHGKAEIGFRHGRAYGKYTANISRWVAGWIIGREISPEEILKTNEKHPDKKRYEGKHVSLSGNPSEVWMTEQVDYLTEYERDHYQVDRPISVSSWPTLDPLFHETENPLESQEDVVGIDMAQIEMKDMPGGYFPSFHAYPYYPNFINFTPEYLLEKDAEGINNYIGYIKDLKAHYKNMPLVIGEYGVPSSWGNAHFSPSGMHHGGHSEFDQARFNARLSRDLHQTGTAGGMLFAWIDEWWKRTWIVDERQSPRERFRLWHNLTSPEENFGLIAFDLPAPSFQSMGKAEGRIREVQAAADAAYFHLKITLDKPLTAQEQLVVGFDTYADDLGELVLPNRVKTHRRNEFALTLNQRNQAELLVTQAYDLVGIWHNSSGSQQVYQSTATEGAPWQLVRWQNGQPHTSRDGTMVFPLTHFALGDLHVRADGESGSSLDAVFLKGNTIDIRLPWTMLQFTDPSSLSVTHDNRQTPGRETRVSEGIGIAVSLGSELVETGRYRWPGWDKAPATTERLKANLEVLKQTLNSLPD